MFIHVTDPYLWLPVDQKAPEVKLHFYCDDSKIQEVDIQLGGPDRNFYVSMNVSKYLGRDILIEGDVEEEKLASVFCYGEKARYVYPFRPQIHFSPETGWINDPNGLVFADGVYHLYYQWNPYGIIWGNMHWGHAVSRDLITWEHRPMAMEPDEYGPVFSGCGWQDKENAAGFGKMRCCSFTLPPAAIINGQLMRGISIRRGWQCLWTAGKRCGKQRGRFWIT